jgi:hypothetical protein
MQSKAHPAMPDCQNGICWNLSRWDCFTYTLDPAILYTSLAGGPPAAGGRPR